MMFNRFIPLLLGICLITVSCEKKPIQRSDISIEALAKWDKTTKDVIEKFPLKIEGNPLRLYAYLYSAQEAFAQASSYSGSLSPISLHVLQLFYPSYRQNISASTDPFSAALTEKLVNQIDARFKEDTAQIHPVAVQENEDSWHGKSPYGLEIPSMRPWNLNSPDEFRSVEPPPPNDPFWQEQLSSVKEAMANATENQKKLIVYWAEADWKKIAENYMSDHQVPLKQRLEVRKKLATVILDANIAVFDSKYAYMVRRPNMLDPTLKSYIHTPEHPSYPAGHSTVSTAVAHVLSFYFPENQEEWERMAEECGMTRIWAGIHFPIDHSAGKELGLKVGSASL